jgi:hypothetical protein
MALTDRYRNLAIHEVKALTHYGCSCDDWSRVRVKEGFDPSRCKNVIFSGDIILGVFSESFTDESGISIPTGILNARLHNCIIGSNVVINNIGDYIANYNIEDKVVIRNCGVIRTEGISTFGNGTSVKVLDETGGRAVKIWDGLSAHEAYIIALYRHRYDAVRIIEKMVDDYSISHSSGTGTIGQNSRIFNCSNICNVKFGPSSHIDGSLMLNEGSVNSSSEDPVFIGPGVIMKHFIVCSGSVVTESALVDKCFIGQGCVLAKQFSAENSIFFANCSGYHGEACSLFAGPYTVTHHKSTLLIAAIFSFMNAGSGSNQSNHMYKLGPVHQGIVERGSKTTSDSYLLWPARIGPFSTIIGRHHKNLDTSSFPFSYLIESGDESLLVPGINLRNVGTIRDARKWPERDKRKDTTRIDQLNFNLLSPYTVQRMFEGREILRKLRAEFPQGTSSFPYNSMIITGTSLDRGIELYQTGINKFLGNALIKRLEKRQFKTNEELQHRLGPAQEQGKGEWVDLAGMIVPKNEIEKLLNDIESGKIGSLEELAKSFFESHNSYNNWEWTWVCEKIEQETGISVNRLTADNVISIVEKWEKSVIDLDNLLYEDARKEFTFSSMTGFGIDGGEEIKKLDFKQVRGDFESNNVVTAIQEHTGEKKVIGDELIKRMKSIR